MAEDVALPDIDWEALSRRYIEFWETFQESTLEKLRELASPTIRYRDPMSDVTGIENVIAYLHGLPKNLDQLRVQILGSARDGNMVYSQWIMTFQIRKAPKGATELPGMSAARFDEQGRLVEQSDYWDSAPLLASFPVLGRAVTLTEKLDDVNAFRHTWVGVN